MDSEQEVLSTAWSHCSVFTATVGKVQFTSRAVTYIEIFSERSRKNLKLWDEKQELSSPEVEPDEICTTSGAHAALTEGQWVAPT